MAVHPILMGHSNHMAFIDDTVSVCMQEKFFEKTIVDEVASAVLGQNREEYPEKEIAIGVLDSYLFHVVEGEMKENSVVRRASLKYFGDKQRENALKNITHILKEGLDFHLGFSFAESLLKELSQISLDRYMCGKTVVSDPLPEIWCSRIDLARAVYENKWTIIKRVVNEAIFGPRSRGCLLSAINSTLEQQGICVNVLITCSILDFYLVKRTEMFFREYVFEEVAEAMSELSAYLQVKIKRNFSWKFSSSQLNFMARGSLERYCSQAQSYEPLDYSELAKCLVSVGGFTVQ